MTTIRYPRPVTDPGRGYSVGLFGNIEEVVRHEPDRGFFVFDDFINAPVFASATAQLGYKTYQDTGVTIKPKATISTADGEFGVLEIAGNDADNDEGSIETGSGVNGIGKITNTSGEAAVLVCETRIAIASLSNNGLSMFFGFAEPGFAAANALVDDTGEIADKDLVGFQILAADGDQISACYRISGGDKVTVLAAAAVPVAGDYIKLGVRFDPNADVDKQIQFFVNGKAIGYYITSTVIAGDTFPGNQPLCVALATKVGAAAEIKAYVDWFCYASVLVD